MEMASCWATRLQTPKPIKARLTPNCRSNADRDEGPERKGAEPSSLVISCSLDEVETADRNREREDGEDRRETRFPERVRDRNRKPRHDRGQKEAGSDVHPERTVIVSRIEVFSLHERVGHALVGDHLGHPYEDERESDEPEILRVKQSRKDHEDEQPGELVPPVARRRPEDALGGTPPQPWFCCPRLAHEPPLAPNGARL